MKKGFTLLELLAVIVVLAIIALIAYPIILNIIETSRQRSAVIAAENYIRAVNYKIAQEEVKGNVTPAGDYVIGENELEVDVKNGQYITGEYSIDNSVVLTAGLCVRKYSVEYSSGKAYLEKSKNYCSDEIVFEEPNGEILSELCKGTTDELNTLYTNNSEFKIRTAEDLACFSKITNTGKYFDNKKVYLVSDIDLNDRNSYSNYKVKGIDANGDGNLNEELYTEFTTGVGFNPIKNFKGEFYGYAFTISNLMINRPTTDNIGLFSQNEGKISGLKMRNSSVIGKNNVGILIGKNSGGTINNSNVKNLDIQGSVKGNNYVGGLIGQGDTYTRPTDFVLKANVEGNNYVAGVLGYSNNSTNIAKGVLYDSTITGTTNVGRVGTTGMSSDTNANTMVSSTTTQNPTGGVYSGTTYTVNDMMVFDKVLDTIIGGDNDRDNYYFDFDGNGNITLFSTARKPIRNKLKGEGTESKPYIITSVKDWNSIVTTLDSTPHYYSVTKDIDFTGKTYYPIGTNTNKFNGIIKGNHHTISNVNVTGYDNVGLIGYNTGTVEGLKFNNITIKGLNNNVGIIANNAGTIKGIVVRNANVEGNNYVGILIGKNSGGTIDNLNVKNLDIQGSVKGNNYVGGLIGQGDSFTRPTDFVLKANVEGNNYVAGVLGYSNNGTNIAKGVVYDSTITGTTNVGRVGTTNMQTATNTNTMVSSTTTQNPTGGAYPGTTYTVNDMMVFDRVLDTIIGGDNDSDGYYFDFDGNGSITLYSTDERPLNGVLRGIGTQENPYLISNVNEWNMITATVNDVPKYYSVIADIDFTGKRYYPIGTNTNKFNGIIKGNHHTISNVNVTGYDNVGLIGYNTGTIRDIKFSNITIKGSNNNVGIIANNEGIINGITVRNASVEGNNYVGILIGKNSGGTINNLNVKNLDIQGSVKGNSNVGGLIGQGDNYTRPTDFVLKANVEGNNYVAGVLGYSNNATNIAKGVVYDSTITGSTNVGRVGTVAMQTATNTNTMVSSSTTQNPTGGSYPGTTYTVNDMIVFDRVLDTIIGGDNDADKYYFDYDLSGNIALFSTDERPIRNTLNGLGTESNPYIINTANDWNIICTTIDSTAHYYSITNDIDFTGKTYYPIGTNVNKFNGVLMGNHHTISNVSVTGYDNVGLVGYTTGTIQDIKFNNITIKGLNNNVGIIGYNTGEVRGIVVRGTNVEGNNNVGILVGHNSGGLINGINIKNVDIQGSVKGNQYVGGLIGTGDSYAKISDFVLKANVEGNNYVAGVLGYSNNGNNTTKGVLYDSTITGSTNVGRVGTVAMQTATNTNTMVLNTTQTPTGGAYSGTTITDRTLEAVNGVLDTTIGGDNDSDGYYFTLTNGNFELIPSN